MRTKVVVTAAALALLSGPFGMLATAHAAQNSHDTTTYTPTPTSIVQPLDCHGTTGYMGCGPGWVWNGNRCVPC